MDKDRTLVSATTRALIGYTAEPLTTSDAVSTSEVRRFAQAIMDDNPVFFDESAAKASRFRGIVAPGTYPLSCLRPTPLALDPLRTATARDETWTNPIWKGISQPAEWAGLYGFHTGDDIELFRLAHLGDIITGRTSVSNIFEKTGRAGPLAFFTRRTEWTNQHGEVLCVSQLHTAYKEVKTKGPRAPAHSLLEPAPVAQPPAPPLHRVNFEEMKVGQELPVMVRRVTPPVIMRWCAAAEIYRRDHFDYTYATQTAGLPDIIGSAAWAFSCLWSYLSGIAGKDGWTWKISQQVRARMLMGDTLSVTGKVLSVEQRKAYGLVEVEFALKNQEGVAVMPGRATLALPLRTGEPVPYPFLP